MKKVGPRHKHRHNQEETIKKKYKKSRFTTKHLQHKLRGLSADDLDEDMLEEFEAQTDNANNGQG